MKMRDVCLRTGLTERTVRFYVEQGLLQPDRTRMNGRTYLSFSEADIDTLADLATLRQAQFSIGEIAALQADFAQLPALLEGKAQALHTGAAQAEAYATALEQLQPSQLRDLRQLAQALRQPAGAYEPAPRFGRFDPETTRERDAAYEAFLAHSARRETRRRWLLTAGAAVLLVVLSVWCTLWAVDALPRRTAPTAPTSSLVQRYTEAQLLTLEGSFRAWLEPAADLVLQEAGLDAITGNLIVQYANQGSCVLTVECEPLDEMVCTLVDDQSLPPLTLLTHPETPEARVELIVPGGAEHRYYAVYLYSDTLTEDEIIDQFGQLFLRMPWGSRYRIADGQWEALPAEDGTLSQVTRVDTLPAPAEGQWWQRFRRGYWYDLPEGDPLPAGLYRLTDADGQASYCLLGDSDDWPEQPIA